MCTYCDEIRKDKIKGRQGIELNYSFYTSLKFGYGWIAAEGEGFADIDINYCPFCGEKFEKI